MDDNTTVVVGTGVVTFIFGYLLHIFTKRSDRYDDLEKRIRDLELGHQDIAYIKDKQGQLEDKINKILDTVTELRVEVGSSSSKRTKREVVHA